MLVKVAVLELAPTGIAIEAVLVPDLIEGFHASFQVTVEWDNVQAAGTGVKQLFVGLLVVGQLILDKNILIAREVVPGV